MSPDELAGENARRAQHDDVPLEPEHLAGEQPITGTATPRAIATLVGLLGLRPPEHDAKQTEIRPDGSVIWRLNGGVTVEMWSRAGEFVRWHLDRDAAPAPRRGGGGA